MLGIDFLKEDIIDNLEWDKDVIDEDTKLVVGISRDTNNLTCGLYNEKYAGIERVAIMDFEEGFKVYDADSFLLTDNEINYDRVANVAEEWA